MLIFAGIPPFHSCEGRNLFPRSGIPLLSKASITAKIPAFAGMEECDGNPPHSPHIKKAPPFPNSPQIPPSPFPRKRESPDSSGEAANHRQRRQNREIPAFAGMGSMLIFAGIPPIPFLRRQESLSAKRNPPIVESIHHRKDSCLCRNGRVRRKSPPFPPSPHIKKSTPIPKLPPFPPIPIPAKAGISRLQRRSRESPPKAAKQGDSRFRGNGKYVNFRGNPPIPFLRRQESLSAKRNPPIVESIHHRKDSCLCRNGRVRRKSPPIPPIPPYKKSTPIPKLPPFPPIPIPAKAGISRLQRRSRESPPKAAK